MTTPTTRTTSRPCVSVPASLLAAYNAARATPAGASLPGLSALLQQRLRALLVEGGFPVPDAATVPPRTAAATRARWQRGPEAAEAVSKKSTRDPSRGS